MTLRQSAGRALVFALLLITTPNLLAAQSFSGAVARVVDGDTFYLSGIKPSIRVWGLDAPERKQTGGTKATNMMRTLISDQTLTCSYHDTDRYGRIVGQCFLPDGRDVASAMIQAGVATEYCRYSRGYYGTC